MTTRQSRARTAPTLLEKRFNSGGSTAGPFTLSRTDPKVSVSDARVDRNGLHVSLTIPLNNSFTSRGTKGIGAGTAPKGNKKLNQSPSKRQRSSQNPTAGDAEKRTSRQATPQQRYNITTSSSSKKNSGRRSFAAPQAIPVTETKADFASDASAKTAVKSELGKRPAQLSGLLQEYSDRVHVPSAPLVPYSAAASPYDTSHRTHDRSVAWGELLFSVSETGGPRRSFISFFRPPQSTFFNVLQKLQKIFRFKNPESEQPKGDTLKFSATSRTLCPWSLRAPVLSSQQPIDEKEERLKTTAQTSRMMWRQFYSRYFSRLLVLGRPVADTAKTVGARYLKAILKVVLLLLVPFVVVNISAGIGTSGWLSWGEKSLRALLLNSRKHLLGHDIQSRQGHFYLASFLDGKGKCSFLTQDRNKADRKIYGYSVDYPADECVFLGQDVVAQEAGGFINYTRTSGPASKNALTVSRALQIVASFAMPEFPLVVSPGLQIPHGTATPKDVSLWQSYFPLYNYTNDPEMLLADGVATYIIPDRSGHLAVNLPRAYSVFAVAMETPQSTTQEEECEPLEVRFFSVYVHMDKRNNVCLISKSRNKLFMPRVAGNGGKWCEAGNFEYRCTRVKALQVFCLTEPQSEHGSKIPSGSVVCANKWGWPTAQVQFVLQSNWGAEATRVRRVRVFAAPLVK